MPQGSYRHRRSSWTVIHQGQLPECPLVMVREQQPLTASFHLGGFELAMLNDIEVVSLLTLPTHSFVTMTVVHKTRVLIFTSKHDGVGCTAMWAMWSTIYRINPSYMVCNSRGSTTRANRFAAEQSTPDEHIS